MTKIKNLKFSNKLFSLILAGTLSMTLVGCGSNEVNTTENTNTTNEQPSEEATNSQNTVVDGVKDAVSSEYEKVKGDNAVEAAITVMLDGAEKVGDATDEFKQTEEYQEAKDQLVSNFDTLLGFCFNDKEINGYTIHDVSDNVKEKAKSALYTLDGYIEKNIPDYKEKAKEKLKAAGAWLYDKSTDIGAAVVDKGSQWLDEVKEKAKQR